MRLSFYSSVADAMPRHRDLTWDEFCQDLKTAPVVADKRQAPCFSPAEYPEGATRSKGAVTALHMAVLDIDQITSADLNALWDKITPYAYAAYSTLSHPAKVAKTPDTWALRLIFPLDKPISSANWPRFWARLHTFCNQAADPQCKDPSRLYILPCRYAIDPPPTLEIHAGAHFAVDQVADVPENPPEQPTGQRIHKPTIQMRAKNLLRREDEESHTLAANLRALLAGRPYGAPGKRNKTMLTLTWELDRLFPGATPADIAELFIRSHGAMADLDAEMPDPLGTVIKAIEGARRIRLERRQAALVQANTTKQLRIEAARQDGQNHAYTDDEIDAIAAMHDIPLTKLQHHWILRHGNQCHFLGPQGYSDAFSGAHGILPTAYHRLAPVSQITLHEIRGQGATLKTVPRSWDSICIDYATDIRHVVYDLCAEYSRLDYKAMRLHLASAMRSKLTPTEHPKIHQWLTLLGGDKAETFLQWIAAVPDMTKQLCAVYLHGAQGVGKTVFAHGLSKLWQRGLPTPFVTAVSKFNYDLATCPLILVDEGFPHLPPRQLATELRTLIGGDEIRVEQKFGGSFPLLGPRRMILAANNTSLLDFKSELSHDDLEALAVRIMQITPDTRARDVFATLSPQEFRAWQTHRIAEHALWLSEHHAIAQAPGQRFHVQGELDDTMRQVVVDGHYTSLACQVLVRYITSPMRKTERKPGLIRFGDGELWVNQEGLHEVWLDILSRGPQPPAKLGALLRSLSHSRTSRNIKTGGMVKRFWPIDLYMLAVWCDSNGYLSSEILALIAAPARVEMVN